MKLLSFFAANKLILSVVIIVIGVVIWVGILLKNNTQYKADIESLKKEVISKNLTIMSMAVDTAHYISALKVAYAKVDSLEKQDKKSNPGLKT